MAFVAVPNTAEIVIGFVLFGQQVCITRHVTKPASTPWTVTELFDAEAPFRDAFHSGSFTVLGGALKWRQVSATDISVAGGAQAVDTSFAGEGGGASGATAPGGVTFALTFRTGHVGRAFRGRNYIPGIPEPAIDGNEVLTTFAEALANSDIALAAAVTAAGFTWTVVSRNLNNAPRPTPVALPITGVGYSDLSLDSQRRRLNGRGS